MPSKNLRLKGCERPERSSTDLILGRRSDATTIGMIAMQDENRPSETLRSLGNTRRQKIKLQVIVGDGSRRVVPSPCVFTYRRVKNQPFRADNVPCDGRLVSSNAPDPTKTPARSSETMPQSRQRLRSTSDHLTQIFSPSTAGSFNSDFRWTTLELFFFRAIFKVVEFCTLQEHSNAWNHTASNSCSSPGWRPTKVGLQRRMGIRTFRHPRRCPSCLTYTGAARKSLRADPTLL